MKRPYPTFRYYYSGGTGSAGEVSNGQLLIGSTGTIPVVAEIQAGAGIQIDNGPGSITVTADAAGGATPAQAAAISLNTEKVGVTPAQASAITANTAKISADGSISTHSDVSTGVPVEGDQLVYLGGVWTRRPSMVVDIFLSALSQSSSIVPEVINGMTVAGGFTGGGNFTVMFNADWEGDVDNEVVTFGIYLNGILVPSSESSLGTNIKGRVKQVTIMAYITSIVVTDVVDVRWYISNPDIMTVHNRHMIVTRV